MKKVFLELLTINKILKIPKNNSGKEIKFYEKNISKI